MTGPAVDTGSQLLNQVADAVFTDLTLNEGNTEEVSGEHQRTAAYIQCAITDGVLPRPAIEDQILPLVVTQQVVRERTGTDMPLEEIRGRTSKDSADSTGMSTTIPLFEGTSLEEFTSIRMEDVLCRSFLANAREGGRRLSASSAFPKSSPAGSDLGGAGSSRPSVMEQVLQDSDAGGIGSRCSNNSSRRPSIDKNMEGDAGGNGSGSELQLLLEECRQTRRSTMRLLGNSMLESTEQHAQQKADSGSVPSMRMEPSWCEAGHRNSKQEAAASFIASLMRKAEDKLHEQATDCEEETKSRDEELA